MSTLMTHGRCPQCEGYMHIVEDMYGSSCQCLACGLIYDTEMSRDKKVKGYGAICFVEKNGYTEHYSVNENEFQEAYNAFLETINNVEEIDKEKSYITRWDDEKEEIIVEYGMVPDEYRVFNEKVDACPSILHDYISKSYTKSKEINDCVESESESSNYSKLEVEDIPF